jgi:hypothetical protein
MRSFFILPTRILVIFSLALFAATTVIIVDSFLHYHEKKVFKKTRRTAIFSNSQQQRTNARRWNGNYKEASTKLSDVSKFKKLTLNVTANGITKTLQKKREESLQHVLTKAMIWKLFMNDYPNLEIEFDIGDKDYLPDVVSTTGEEISFWGESGRMKVHKALDLIRRYPNAHIVHCRWGMDIEKFMDPFIEYLEVELDAGRLQDIMLTWKGKFSFASIPTLAVWDFIDEDTGTILIERSDLEWKELDLSQLQLLNSTSVGSSGEVDTINKTDEIELEKINSSEIKSTRTTREKRCKGRRTPSVF